MNAVDTFSILLNLDNSEGYLIIPNDFDLLTYPKQIRELTYLYFSEIKNKIANKCVHQDDALIIVNPLTFTDIADYIARDSEFAIIPNTINPEIYYNNDIILSKRFKFDYDFETSQTDNIPFTCVHYTDGWNINNYLKHQKINIYQASRFRHASEVIDLEYVKTWPDLFDLDTLYKRFGDKINPNNFKSFSSKKEYILLHLNNTQKLKYPDEYFISDYDVIMKLFNCKTKRLPYNFEEIIDNIDYLSEQKLTNIADIYVKWLSYNHTNDDAYIYPKLLSKASSLDVLFEKEIHIPYEAKINLNYSSKYITFNDLFINRISFKSSYYKQFKDKVDILLKSINFRDLPKSECIAFYNTFYQPSVEFIKIVFFNKLLTKDDYDRLSVCSVDQLLYFKSLYAHQKVHNKSEINNSIINKVRSVDYYKAVNVGLINDKEFNAKYYDSKYNHDDFVEYILTNKHYITTDVKSIYTEPRLKDNILYKSLIKYDCKEFLSYFINNIELHRDESIPLLREIVEKYVNDINTDDFITLYKRYENIDSNIINNFDMNIVLNDKWVERLKAVKYQYFFDNKTKDNHLFFDQIKDEHITYPDNYIQAWIKSSSKISYEDIAAKLEASPHTYDKYACDWCKYRKCDPPFDMWPATPNRELQKAYRNYVSEELPKEYTDKRFYEYIMKNRHKRPEHCTSVYTLLSNNVENKIIFIDDTQILDDRYAVLRGVFDIDYSQIREYLCEELDTNNISMLTVLSDYDFAKVCGDNKTIDCFVFSDIKNIYKERTPLKKVLDFFINAISIKFDIEMRKENNCC